MLLCLQPQALAGVPVQPPASSRNMYYVQRNRAASAAQITYAPVMDILSVVDITFVMAISKKVYLSVGRADMQFSFRS